MLQNREYWNSVWNIKDIGDYRKYLEGYNHLQNETVLLCIQTDLMFINLIFQRQRKLFAKVKSHAESGNVEICM